ncbi:MAG: dTMP kinase [Spirochaetales bacterium]|nr:dTMP kinase [Spirochaetales bacterium]
MKHKILPRFLVIEGLDGSGTTTQTRMLLQRFEKTAAGAVSTCEPTDYPGGKLIRSILKGAAEVLPETLAMLFSADRNEHLYNINTGIITSLTQNRHVICDRYLFSSLAYQSLECDFKRVFALNCRFPLPERVFFIDTSIHECQDRIGKREKRELFEAETIQYKIRNNYLKAFACYKRTAMKVHMLDGDESAEKIHERIWEIVVSAEK